MPSNENAGKEEANWSYSPEFSSETPGQPQNPSPPNSAGSISWTASEFIDHNRGAGWYTAFFIGLVLVSIGVFVLTRDYISAVAIFFAGTVFVILIKKKPRELSYEINASGVKIGGKLYAYEGFKSFGIAQEDGVKSLSLDPLKRLMPELSVYYPLEHEAAIISILSDHLPHKQPAEKAIDRLAKKLRF